MASEFPTALCTASNVTLHHTKTKVGDLNQNQTVCNRFFSVHVEWERERARDGVGGSERFIWNFTTRNIMQNGNIYNKYMMSVSREKQHIAAQHQKCVHAFTSAAVQRIFFRLLFIFLKFFVFFLSRSMLRFFLLISLSVFGILAKDLIA